MRGGGGECDQGSEGVDGEIERVVRLGVVVVAMTLVTSIGGAADAFTLALHHPVHVCTCVCTTIIVTLYVGYTRRVGT